MKRSPFRESFKLGLEVGTTALARSLASTLKIGDYENYIESVQKRIIELRTEFSENRKTLDTGATLGKYSGLFSLLGTAMGIVYGINYLNN